MGRKDLSEVRRHQIMEAFYRCLVKKGLEACTISNIAEEAHITPSLITHYFGNKEEMTLELARRILEMYERTLFRQIESIEDPRERLEKLLSGLFNDEYLTEDFVKAYLAIIYRASRDEEVKRDMAKMYRRTYADIKKTLIEIAGTGNLEPGEAEKAAVLITALQDGMSELWFYDPKKARPSLAREMVGDHLDKILGGKTVKGKK